MLLIALPLLAYAEFGELSSNMDWCGAKYTVTINGNLLKQSKVVWDGKAPLPLALNDAIEKSRIWMTSKFPDLKYKFANASLFFFADRLDETKGQCAYIINFENGIKELIKEHNAWRVERLTFYVLMDGSLVTPVKKQNKP